MTKAYDTWIDAILPMSNLFFSVCLSFIPDGQVPLLELTPVQGMPPQKFLRKILNQK